MLGGANLVDQVVEDQSNTVASTADVTMGRAEVSSHQSRLPGCTTRRLRSCRAP